MADIFIVSQHRTGSTLLRNILDAHSDVSMAFDELNLFEPLRKNTMDRLLVKNIKSTDELIGALRQRQIYGTFWKEFEKSGITEEQLQGQLAGVGKPNVEQVVRAILACLRAVSGTSCSGVKYPVHFSRLGLLNDWFPESKIIYLFREPKAMIASKINDPATRSRKKKSRLYSLGVHYGTLLYFCFEFRKSVAIYKQFRDRLLKVRYEELVSGGPTIISELCRFCGIAFEPEMLNVSGKRSSYEVAGRDTLSTTSLDKYKQVLTRFDQWLIDWLTRSAYIEIRS